MISSGRFCRPSLGIWPAERVFAWNTLEVLGIECGSATRAIGAIPPSAKAVLQMRYVVGTDLNDIEARLQPYLVEQGFASVQIKATVHLEATRHDPDHPAVALAVQSILHTTGMTPTIQPNLGNTISNDAFAHVLGLPTG